MSHWINLATIMIQWGIIIYLYYSKKDLQHRYDRNYKNYNEMLNNAHVQRRKRQDIVNVQSRTLQRVIILCEKSLESNKQNDESTNES